MKKFAIIFGSGLLAFMLAMSPVLAQETDGDGSADPSAATETTATPSYRGIIPASGTSGGNASIDCDSPSDLGAKIHCGKVTLDDFPAMIVYLIQWILTLAGGIAVIMIMVGGFQYMLGGLTDDKERGKKTLIYALGGLVVSFMAWWIVELVQVWITS